MIRAEYVPREHTLLVRGHAGSGDPGRDLVCAGVSALVLALREELRRRGSKVVVSTLCPGPVDTEFNNVADVKFALAGLNSRRVAEYAIQKTLQGKAIILPGAAIKLARLGMGLIPATLLSRIMYNMQSKKGGK